MNFRRILKATGRRAKKAGGSIWHSRITILKVLLAVAVGVLCVLPIIFLNTLVGYLPIFFYLLLLILSGIYLLILRGNIKCSAEDRTLSCQRTGSEDFDLSVRNRSVLVAPRVTARITMTGEGSGSGQDTEMTLALSPRELRDFRFNVTFAHLGLYTVGMGDLKIGGLLNILQLKLPGGGEQKVYVTPLRHNPSYLALTDLVETEDSRARASSPRDGADYTGVREYAFGDPMKNIHWKLSAHSNGYMTKQMEVLGNAGVDVVIDLAAPPWTGEDGAFMYDALVESACAVILYAREKGMDSSMWFFDRSGQERNVVLNSAGDFDRILTELPGITSIASEYQLDELLGDASNSMYAKNNIVLCSARVDEDVVRRLEQIQNARRHPAMIYVVPPGLDEREREDRMVPVKNLEHRNIPCHMISTVQELK